jgi:hypothetical protein
MPFLRVRQAEGAHLCAVRSTDRRVARSYADPAGGCFFGSRLGGRDDIELCLSGINR